MRDVSLTLIQTFFIVARDGSYSAAARKLNMSYQSAANHVRRLEQLLGERLVCASSIRNWRSSPTSATPPSPT